MGRGGVGEWRGDCLRRLGLSQSEPAKNAVPDDELSGKTVVLFLDNETQNPSQALTDVEFKPLHGHNFICGRGADTKREDDWVIGRNVRHVEWDKVTGYVVLTPQEFDEVAKRWNQPQ